ncbi:MAG: hypothetical protein JJU45_10925 [Acidimicrobiia bacterium]|nr:hypothetical protein [Acidimicrobiia bacterium]
MARVDFVEPDPDRFDEADSLDAPERFVDPEPDRFDDATCFVEPDRLELDREDRGLWVVATGFLREGSLPCRRAAGTTWRPRRCPRHCDLLLAP